MENPQYKRLEDILTDKDFRTSNGTLVLVCDAELWEKTGIIEQTLRRMTPINFIPDDSVYHARGERVTTTEPFYKVTPKEDVEKIRERQKEIFDEISYKTFEDCKATFLQKLNHEVPNQKKFLESELERYKAFELPSDLKQGVKRFGKIIPEHLDTGYIDVFGERQNEEPKLVGYELFGQWLEKYQLSNEAASPASTSTGAEIVTAKRPNTNQSKIIRSLEKHLSQDYHSLTNVVNEVAVKTNNTPTTVWNTIKSVREGRLKALKLTQILPENV